MTPKLELTSVPENVSNFRFLRTKAAIWYALSLVITLGCCATLTFAEAARLRVQGTLPAGAVGVVYSASLRVSGGSAPYSFRITQGTLPSGLSLDGGTGTISGTPDTVGTFQFELAVSDAANLAGDKKLTIGIYSGNEDSPRVSVSPTTATVTSAGTQQFVATVSNTPNTAVTWSASAGSISNTGFFTAPTVSSATNVKVTATLQIRPAAQASALVVVSSYTGPSPLAISTFSLPSGVVGSTYSAALSASGGTPPYVWNLASGSLPAGIQWIQSGYFSGTPSQAGNFSLTVTVSDATSKSVTQALVLSISTQSSGSYDGPAELPRIYIRSTMADTPAPGTSVLVSGGGNLQSALNLANCGDTIQLQAGTTYIGTFTFPAKSCDDNHWIVVRTSAPDSSLPAEGTRVTPCYAGVSSLPARPAFNCTSTQNVMARLMSTQSGIGPIRFASGANHYRLLGLEATRQPNSIVYSLASIVPGGSADHIVFDRVWLHGTATDETQR
ncbi:MAG: putative Ig domain-containing protein, partial [Acidobacteriota bacterium]|nr:putative Ig domain-containing protein [Acidobacteriota bacterium]